MTTSAEAWEELDKGRDRPFVVIVPKALYPLFKGFSSKYVRYVAEERVPTGESPQ